MKTTYLLCVFVALAACSNDPATAVDAGGTTDLGGGSDAAVDLGTPIDMSTPDLATPEDGATADAMELMDGEVSDAQPAEDLGPADAGVADAARDLGPLPDFGVPSCLTDADCPSGLAWCVGGSCVPCDNSAMLCDIACVEGTELVERNGCTPCECIPSNDCKEDADCSEGGICYQGGHCPDWCPPGDPTCCLGGNQCGNPGCVTPIPAGCRSIGCPYDQRCEASGCVGTSCFCGEEGGWACTRDCGGGTCVPR